MRKRLAFVSDASHCILIIYINLYRRHAIPICWLPCLEHLILLIVGVIFLINFKFFCLCICLLCSLWTYFSFWGFHFFDKKKSWTTDHDREDDKTFENKAKTSLMSLCGFLYKVRINEFLYLWKDACQSFPPGNQHVVAGYISYIFMVSMTVCFLATAIQELTWSSLLF